jgi:hypothetical protein
MKKAILIMLALIVLVIAIMPNTVYTNDNGQMVVEIDDDGVLTVSSAHGKRYTASYGAYYIESNGEPVGYYTFNTGYTGKNGGFVTYSNKINLYDKLGLSANDIKVYSSYGTQSGRDWMDVYDLPAFDNICSGEYRSKFGNIDNVPLVELDKSTQFYLCSDVQRNYDGQIPTTEEIAKIKGTFPNEYNKKVLLADGQSISVPFSVSISNLFNLIKNKINEVLSYEI